MNHATPVEIALMILLVGPILICIYNASRGQPIFIRRISGIDAIDEAVGRAVELGRPMSFTSGLTGVGPLLFSCLGVLKYIGRKAARFNSKILVPSNDPEALALTDATLQNAYRAENRLSNYDPTSVRFLSSDQFAFASGYMGLIQRENVASAFLFGSYAAESLILAEAGHQIGAVQIAATVSPEQIPFFIASCDYTLIGEELYAAGAFLSEDTVERGSLRGQYVSKLLLFLLMFVGTTIATISSFRSNEIKQGQSLELSKLFSMKWGEVLK